MYVDGRKHNSRQKWNNDSQYDCKKSTTHRDAKRLMPAIIALVLASMTKIVRLKND